jgi:hypothetical protein
LEGNNIFSIAILFIYKIIKREFMGVNVPREDWKKEEKYIIFAREKIELEEGEIDKRNYSIVNFAYSPRDFIHSKKEEASVMMWNYKQAKHIKRYLELQGDKAHIGEIDNGLAGRVLRRIVKD